MNAITLTRVTSSQIVAIGHDAAANTLAVLFKNRDGSPGSLYHYNGVSAAVHAALVGAESIGSHFIRNIKPHPEHYPYQKIVGVDPVIVDAPAAADAEAPLYSPLLIFRESDGQFFHPHLPAHEDPDKAEESITPLIREQGFEIKLVDGESDGDAFPNDSIVDGGEAYFDAMRAWNPTPPAGDGWLLAAVVDTEDGPQAWFVRPLVASAAAV